jgi:DNA-binding NtrC family response regulator
MIKQLGMNNMPFSVLLASNDSELDVLMRGVLEKRNFNYDYQPAADVAILSAMDHPVDMLFYDTTDTEDHFDTLSVINSLNPRLPIVVITNDNSIETMKNLAQLKIIFRVIKPVQMHEIESILDAVHAMLK